MFGKISGILGVVMAFVTLCSAAPQSDPKSRLTRSQYIDTWKDEAVRQMKKYGIPASITLAQGILESGDGNSDLARKSNNHFGIKCHDWTGDKVYHDDDARGECFRKYRNAEESYEDHSLFLVNRSRYAFLFEFKPDDYKAWAHGLKKAGYATNPKYPDLLIRIIEENNLDAYDKGNAPRKTKSSDVKPGSADRAVEGSTVEVTASGREVFVSDNRIEFIVVQAGDDYETLRQMFGLSPWQWKRYNDLDRDYMPQAGDKLYTQPKRNKHRSVKTHTVQPGETLKGISQRYGVKLNKLVRRNAIENPALIKPGQEIRLR